jgi:hypothetical protein
MDETHSNEKEGAENNGPLSAGGVRPPPKQFVYFASTKYASKIDGDDKNECTD